MYYVTSESVFRTEYGSPITSHSFRQVLSRAEEELKRVCEADYGFKWEKHVTPHSFRHMHISYLQSREMQISLKDIMSRVGHENFETTMGYTHKISDSQATTVKALDRFVENHQFNFGAVKSWSCKYSAMIEKVLQTQIDTKELEYSLGEFRELLHLKSTYAPKQIVSNIIPKVIKDILKYYQHFTIRIVKMEGNKIKGFKLTW